MDAKHQLKQISPSKPQPYFNNLRHNEIAVPAVAESIQTLAFQQPILIDPEHSLEVHR